MIDSLRKSAMLLLVLLLQSFFAFAPSLTYGDDGTLPHEVKKNFETIIHLTSLRRYTEANTVFDQTIEAYPAIGLLYAGRGAILQQIGQDLKAQEDLSRAIDLNINSPSVFMARGVSRQELRDYAGAMTDLSVAIALDENLTEAIFMRACLFYQLQEFDRAMLDLDKVISKRDNEYEAIILRARCRIETRNFDGAIDDANKASKLRPKESTPFDIRDRAIAERNVYQTVNHESRNPSNIDQRSKRKNVMGQQTEASQIALRSFKQNYVIGAVMLIVPILVSTYFGFRHVLLK